MKIYEKENIVRIINFSRIICNYWCGDKEQDGDYKITNGGINSIVGVYELYEVKTSGKTYAAKEWHEMSSYDYILRMKKDNTASIIITVGDKNGNPRQIEEKFTYDDSAFYSLGEGVNGTKDGQKTHVYTFEKGLITLNAVDTNGNVLDGEGTIYKKK